MAGIADPIGKKLHGLPDRHSFELVYVKGKHTCLFLVVIGHVIRCTVLIKLNLNFLMDVYMIVLDDGLLHLCLIPVRGQMRKNICGERLENAVRTYQFSL